jgi:hypothetical protein
MTRSGRCSRTDTSLSNPCRREDERLVSGHGTYAGGVNLPRQAYAAFVQSIVPHGVLGVFTGDDLVAAGVGPIPSLPMPYFSLARAPAPRPALAVGRVHQVGARIALVVAETADAAELIWPDIDNVALHWPGGDAGGVRQRRARDPAAAGEQPGRRQPDRAPHLPCRLRRGDRNVQLGGGGEGVQYMLRVLCEHVFRVPR